MQEGDCFFIEVVTLFDIVNYGEKIALYGYMFTIVYLRGYFMLFFTVD